MARKRQTRAKAPAKRAKRTVQASPGRAAASSRKPQRKRLRIIVIDDELGAGAGPNKGYNREMFLRDMSDAPADWFLSDAHDSFTGFFLTAEALAFVAASPKPDVFLIDLMFGDNGTLGLEIVSALQERFPRVPMALLTTHTASDVVETDKGPVTIGDWVHAHGIGLINKEAIFRQGALWQSIKALLPRSKATDKFNA